jgi:hypothetical protein
VPLHEAGFHVPSSIDNQCFDINRPN